jgi:Fe2+ transport system protein FeoA
MAVNPAPYEPFFAAPEEKPDGSRTQDSHGESTPPLPQPSRTLYDLVTGDVARITRIRGGGPRSIRQRLLDMGVTRGTVVEVRRHAPLGDPVEVVIKGYYLALRMREAREIEVEEVR